MWLSQPLRVASWLSCPILLLLIGGCQSVPGFSVAQKGSLTELQKELGRARQNQLLDRPKLQRLARGILDREIHTATDPDGVDLLARLGPCARTLREPLERRAMRQDRTAGAAQLLLVEAGLPMSDSDWQSAAESAQATRRAAAARNTQPSTRWFARSSFLNDAEPRVRRAALASCLQAPSRDDWDALIAILRRDPDPSCRQLAAKAIGGLGGPEASSVLYDAWARADLDLRLAIVSGWAKGNTFADGGRERLVAIARAESGKVGVLAAADLARGNSTSRYLGQARITRTLEFGSTDDRPLAITAADWSLPEQSELLLRLGLTAESETRVYALERWLEVPTHRWPAITWLRGIADEDSVAGIMAREILAKANVRAAQGSLRAQLHYAHFESRAHAAHSLWRLNDMGGMTMALADDAPEVRMTAACVALSED